MKKLMWFIGIVSVGFLIGTATAQSVNPQTGITWPRVTGAGVPTATCPSSTNTTTTATVGTPYTNTSANTQYVCSTGGWTLLGSGSGLNQLTGDVTAGPGTGSQAATVHGINNTILSGLATGILKNTTGTGVPSIAAAADIPGCAGNCVTQPTLFTGLNQVPVGALNASRQQVPSNFTMFADTNTDTISTTDGRPVLIPPCVFMGSYSLPCNGGTDLQLNANVSLGGATILLRDFFAETTYNLGYSAYMAANNVAPEHSVWMGVNPSTIPSGVGASKPDTAYILTELDNIGLNISGATIEFRGGNQLSALSAATIGAANTFLLPTLGASTSGLLKSAATTGLVSNATAGTDYQVPITLTTTGTSGAATLSAGTLNIPNYSGGGGGGTVTTFSAGTLSPLFTTSVATATSTPALTFSLSNAATHTVFGNPTSGTAAPSFTTTPFVTSIAAGTSVLSATGINTGGNDFSFNTASANLFLATASSSAVVHVPTGNSFKFEQIAASSIVSTDASNVVTAAATTGSGSVVLATSPTLVTPLLGTPTSGVITNLTGTCASCNIGGNAATATTSTNLAGGVVGDVPYQASGGSTGFALPNTTVVKQFLSETGNGVVGAQPVFSLIGASDWSPNDFIAGAGSVNVMTATLVPAAVTLTAGLRVEVLPNLANTTTTPTLNVNGLGAKTITKNGTAALAASDYTTTAIADFEYDGTQWQLLNPQTVGAGTPAYPQTITGGVSGGIVYGSLSTQLTVSPAGIAGDIVTWGGAATAPGDSGVAVPQLVNFSRSLNCNGFGDSITAFTGATNLTLTPNNTAYDGFCFRMGGVFNLFAISGAEVPDMQTIFMLGKQAAVAATGQPNAFMMIGTNEATVSSSAAQVALYAAGHQAALAFNTIPSNNYNGGAFNSATAYANIGDVVQSGGISYISASSASFAPPNTNKTPASNPGYWIPYIAPPYFKIAAQTSTLLTGTWTNDITVQGQGSPAPQVQSLGVISSQNGATIAWNVPTPAGNPIEFGNMIMDGNTGTATVTINGSAPGANATILGNAASSAVIKTASQANSAELALVEYPTAATGAVCNLASSQQTSSTVASLTFSGTCAVATNAGVSFSGLTNLTWLNGLQLQVQSVTGSVFTVNFSHATQGSATESTNAQALPGNFFQITVSSTPTDYSITNVAWAGSTNIGTFAASTLPAVGKAVYIHGLATATFLNGVRLTVLTSGGGTFTASGTATSAGNGQFSHATYASAADTGTASINWIAPWFLGTYPAASNSPIFQIPNLQVLGVLKQQNDANAAATAAYNTQALADYTTLKGHGAPLGFVDVRTGIYTLQACNPFTGMSDQFHPGDVCHAAIGAQLESALQVHESEFTSLILRNTATPVATGFGGITLSGTTFNFGNGANADTSYSLSGAAGTFSGTVKGSVVYCTNWVTSASASYSQTGSECGADLTNTAARTVTLAANFTAPFEIEVHDGANTAGTGNISVVVSGGGTIDGLVGGPSSIINVNGGSAKFRYVSSGVWRTTQPTSTPIGENVVSFSATPTFSAGFASNIITLTGNVTSSTLAAGIPGQGMSIIVCQDGTGSRTFVPPTNVKGFGTIGNTPSSCNSQHIVYSGSKTNWYADAAMVMNE